LALTPAPASKAPPASAPYALYALLALYFCWPLFEQPLALGIYDWDQHLFYYGVVLKNLVEYGQMPFWNPWYCGGNVMWQNPQVAILSPAYALGLVVPLQLAMKINIVLHYWIGFAGMHLLLTRVIGLTFLPAVLFIATLVTASGAPAIHLRAGHSVFLPGFYLPFQLYFFFTAFKTGELKYVWLAAITLALMIFNGGTHILPMTVAALGSFAVFAAIGRRDWRPLALVILFGLAGVAYSAPKLLPVAGFVMGEQFWDTRNPIEKPDLVTREVLWQTYLVPTRKVGSRLPMQRHGWHEYGNYIGVGSAIALVAGLLLVIVRRSPLNHWFGMSLALTAIVMFLLSLGEFSPYAPAVLSQRLPLFSSFRIPSRYTIPFVQFAALALAWAVQSIVARHGLSRWPRVAVTLVCLLASAHLMYVNRWNLRGVFSEPPFDTSFHWMAGPTEIATDQVTSPYLPGSPMFRALVENRAFYHCYESLQLLRAADPEKPRLFVEGPARVTDVTFSPNRLEFNVFGGPEPARLLMNANWAPGWTSTVGPMEPGDKGRMPSVTIAPGQTGRFAISFTPPWLWPGTALLAIAGVVSALTWGRRFSAIWQAPGRILRG
jgi:multisubunit Na+/H+ antiporter MnhC subunit